jgi:hypothetical protein
MRTRVTFMKLLALIATSVLLVSCSDSTKTESSAEDQTDVSCVGDGVLTDDGLGGIAYDSKCKVPEFPKKIRDYVLDRTVENQEIRIFEGDNWRGFLTPYRAGNTMSCQPEIWVVRWRTQNPSVKIDISQTYGGFDAGDPTDSLGEPVTDGSFDDDSDWVAFFEPEMLSTGSAGYESGQSCSQPVFKWNSNPAGDANLVDISFEYQVWTYKQEI